MFGMHGIVHQTQRPAFPRNACSESSNSFSINWQLTYLPRKEVCRIRVPRLSL